MAYTIVKSDGTVLTTIADGTINTTSTSLGLPGRNYAGYGQQVDTNFVHQVENFAASTPPANPLRGQLWYDTNNSILKVCPVDGTTSSSAWVTLAVSSGSSTTTFGAVNVTGNLTTNNMTALNAIVGDTITVRLATVTANATIANATITTATTGTLNSAIINAGSGNTTPGTVTGTWTMNGGLSGNTLIVTNGNIVASTGIRTDNYYYANGSPFNPSGTYNNGNVSDYLTGANSIAQFTGNIAPGKVTSSTITTGSNITGGSLTGVWTVNGNSASNALVVTGNIVAVTGVKTDNYYYANGSPYNPAGTYKNSNVYDYMTGSNAISQFTGNIAPGQITSTNITTGANTSAGTLTGTWTANGGSAGNTLVVTNGNLVAVTGVKTDNYYYANGAPFAPPGLYTNSNVYNYLTGLGIAQFTGNIAPTQVTSTIISATGTVTGGNISTGGVVSATGNITGGNLVTVGTVGSATATHYGNILTTGANTNAGTITGNWALSTGSRLLSTYADLAERFEADAIYDAGTVVEMGGDKEITAVQYELSEDVFGVVSTTAGYLMNAMAGDDNTHPAIAVGGRVHVKVTGKVRKGQRLVSAGNGIARAAKPGEATAFNIIGRALEHKITDELGVVEAFVKIN
jgi:hypothetical protein